MGNVVIDVCGLSKKYQLGTIGTGTLTRDLNKWWAKVRGKEDPYSPVDRKGVAVDRNADFWALRDVSFEVNQGDAIGIIGKNGAGKSTLLKILSRVTAPTSGEVRVNGRIASLLEVGTGFHQELTGRENIFLNGAILGMTKREIKSKLDEIIAFSGVEEHIDTPVKRYSSGMYVRLAFAVAAHLEPEILIIDEVLAVGDAEFQKKCLGKMNQVASEGRTILFVSHNMAAISTLCNKGVVLRGGKVLFNGNVEDAVDRYMDITAADHKAEVVWNSVESAPGDTNVRVVGVRVLNKYLQVSENLPIDEEFYLEIDLFNCKDGNYLTSNFQLFHRNGVGVLSTGNWASATSNIDAYAGAAYKKGFYKSRVLMPANFLNEGTYFVNALVLQDASIIRVFVDEAVSFNIVDTGEMRKEYTDEWLGVVRPKLEWHTNPM